MRSAEIKRKTAETDIEVSLNLDGNGVDYSIDTGVGFLDHMLTLFSRHSGISLSVKCKGDTQVDFHHSVEDVGIALGRAIDEALGDKRGIRRYASVNIPMDEALILCAVDISGRGGFYTDLSFPSDKIGDFDTELVEEFFIALSQNAKITLHIRQICGRNSHHIAEGSFKAAARALREAVEIDSRFANEIPSTKEKL